MGEVRKKKNAEGGWSDAGIARRYKRQTAGTAAGKTECWELY